MHWEPQEIQEGFTFVSFCFGRRFPQRASKNGFVINNLRAIQAFGFGEKRGELAFLPALSTRQVRAFQTVPQTGQLRTRRLAGAALLERNPLKINWLSRRWPEEEACRRRG